MIRQISIQVVEHDCQRYSTVGDYVEDFPGKWRVLVSDTGNWRYNMLIALHELSELISTQSHGVKEDEIFKFDVSFRHNSHANEPGDSSIAPYNDEHSVAEGMERILAGFIGVKWENYSKAIDALWKKKKHRKKPMAGKIRMAR